jgi:hypothetical protein
MIMVALVFAMLIDTSLVKVNDLINKYFIPIQSKLILFSVNSSLCLLLQYFIGKYIKRSFERDRQKSIANLDIFYIIFLASLGISAALIGSLIFQQFYNNYYDTSISISLIGLSYGIAAALVIRLSLLFLSWYKSNHNLIVFLYSVSMLGIAFNLIMAAAFVSAKVNTRPNPAGEYVGSSGDVSGGRYPLLNNVYRISLFISFSSIWSTTALLMNNYREKLTVLLSIGEYCLYHLFTF